ncbi:hypothetical protein HK414_16150 [Ramlibacter terrae]|uniref:Auto-transporter adhesin head GIN domain-containing protein n=1 Tax=Ramlibacter terrae TaxID=2732511 RepID=A0ABX6P561_9BURK|nr:hypothetical protein HK414_16150 [Ramlibacter terrae]
MVDFSADATVLTLGGTEFSMDGGSGELLRATGDLEIDVAGYFHVEGSFGIESRTQEVTLSDGSVITVKVLSIGGEGIDAFAGMSGGTDDAVGLELGNVDFALALMTDTADATRKFTALQASAGLAGFIGIDDLVVSSSDLKVNINRGVTIAARDAQTISQNTLLELDVAATTGTLRFTRGGDQADITLDPKAGNARSWRS